MRKRHDRVVGRVGRSAGLEVKNPERIEERVGTEPSSQSVILAESALGDNPPKVSPRNHLRAHLIIRLDTDKPVNQYPKNKFVGTKDRMCQQTARDQRQGPLTPETPTPAFGAVLAAEAPPNSPPSEGTNR